MANKTTVTPKIDPAEGRVMQMRIRNHCARYCGCIHFLPTGTLGCARHNAAQERELLRRPLTLLEGDKGADPAKVEEARAAHEESCRTLCWNAAPADPSHWEGRECPTLRAWDSVLAGVEPDLDALSDQVEEYITGKGEAILSAPPPPKVDTTPLEPPESIDGMKPEKPVK